MRSLLFLIVVLSLFSNKSVAKQHAISPVLSYNLSQTDTPAYGLFYQYNFYEAIELELGLLQKNNIELNENSLIRSGQYDSIFIGTNFIRQYTKDTQLKMGGGVSYISTSSNDQLVEQESYSPYVKFSANMSFSKNISVELGQMTQFIIGDVELSHNVFLGLTWKFGNAAVKSPSITKPSNVIVAEAEPALPKATPASPQEISPSNPALTKIEKDQDLPLPITSTITSAKFSPEPLAKTLKKDINKAITKDIVEAVLTEEQAIPPAATKSSAHWVIQLGAFKGNFRAVKQRAIMETQLDSADKTELRIVDHKGLYKIFSPRFTNRQQAAAWLKNVKSSYQWSGFPVFFAD